MSSSSLSFQAPFISVFLSVYIYLMSFCLSMSTDLYVYLYIYRSVRLSMSNDLSVYVYFFVYLYIILSCNLLVCFSSFFSPKWDNDKIAQFFLHYRDQNFFTDFTLVIFSSLKRKCQSTCLGYYRFDVSIRTVKIGHSTNNSFLVCIFIFCLFFVLFFPPCLCVFVFFLSLLSDYPFVYLPLSTRVCLNT